MHVLHPRRRTVALLFVIPLAAFTIMACTHDFASYEPTNETELANPEASAGTDGAIEAGKDASTNPGTDASTTNDAAVDCSSKASCKTTLTSCDGTCDQKRSTCLSGCGGSNKCKRDCNDTRDDCTSSCKDTCRSCAGNGCSSVCN